MKQIFISLLILFTLFVFVGFFFVKKENKTVKVSELNFEQKPKSSTSSPNNILEELQLGSFLGLTAEFQEKVNEDVSKMTEKLIPDSNKSVSLYKKEIEKLQEKFNLPTNQKEIPPEFFLNLAKELSLIQPPKILYSLHLELIKTYYTLGLALKEAEETKDINKKILLYNFISNTLEEIKF